MLAPWLVLALLPVLLAAGLALARARIRFLEQQASLAREVARHQEVLLRSARWIRDGRMRAVLSERGATTWHLTVAAQHLELAGQADAGAAELPELAFLADQHRLMHHLFMTAPLITASASSASKSPFVRARSRN
jgi:hypothetical protein